LEEEVAEVVAEEVVAEEEVVDLVATEDLADLADSEDLAGLAGLADLADLADSEDLAGLVEEDHLANQDLQNNKLAPNQLIHKDFYHPTPNRFGKNCKPLDLDKNLRHLDNHFY
jgi:hypothetical protein